MLSGLALDCYGTKTRELIFRFLATLDSKASGRRLGKPCSLITFASLVVKLIRGLNAFEPY